MNKKSFDEFKKMSKKEQAQDLINDANNQIKEYEHKIEMLKKSIELVKLANEFYNNFEKE